MPRWTCLRLLIAWASIGAFATARAGGPPDAPAKPSDAPTAEEAAEAAKTAFAAKDDTALAAIAKSIDPDAWVVGDLLVSLGSPDVARAVAAQAPGPSKPALVAYLPRRTVGKGETARRDAIRPALAALRAGRNDEAVRLATAFPDAPRDVLWIRSRNTLGWALERTGKFPEAAKVCAEAAGVAETLGWIARAASLRFAAGRAAWAAKDGSTAEREYAAALVLHEREGSLRGQATCLLNLGVARRERGDVDGARAAWTEALARAKASKHAETIAMASGNLAILLELNDGDTAALPFRETSVEAWRAAGNRDRLALALAQLAGHRARMGDLAGGHAALAEADAMGEGVTDARARAEVAFHGAKAVKTLGDLGAALTRLDQALEWAGPAADARFRGNVRFIRAVTLYALDRPGEALAEVERALPDVRAAGDGNEIIDTLRNLALFRLAVGDAAGARPAIEESLALARRLRLKVLEDRCLQTRAGILARLGETEAAVRDLETAARDHAAGGRELEAASANLALADVLAQAGKGAAALAAWTRAKDAFVARKAWRPLVGAWQWRGQFHDRRQEATLTEEAYREAVAAARAAPDPRELARALRNLGITLRDEGRRTAARRSLEESATSARAAGDASFEALALCDLATVEEFSLGLEGKARLLEQALATAQRGSDRGIEVSILINLSRTLVLLHRAPEAIPRLDQARRLAEAAHDLDNLAWIEVRLARARIATGALDEAARAAAESLRLWEGLKDPGGIVRATLAVGDICLLRGELDAARAAYARVDAGGSRREAHSGLADVEMRAGRYREAAAAAREAVRLLPLDLQGLTDEEASRARSSGRGAVAMGLDAAVALKDAGEAWFFLEAGRGGALLTSLAVIEAIRAQGASGIDHEALGMARSREASAARDVRESEARGDPKAYEKAKAELATAQEARRALLRDAERDALARAQSAGATPASLAEVQSVLRPEEALVLHERRGTSLVTLVVRANEVRLVPARPVPTAEVDVLGQVNVLRDLLVTPLGLPDDVRCVLVSPFEDWSDLPYGLLWQGRDVALVPSGSVLRSLRRRGAARGEGVLALGDPVYAAAPAGAPLARLRSGELLLPLPGTRIEAEAVGTKALLGAGATEAALRQALATHRWRALHFACHGLLNAQGPDRPGLALTAFGDDDGVLTVDDVLEMGCPADVVVLSACRSGLGRVAPREGVLGLPRAFLLAGANAVVASQTSVDDETTLALMKVFHRRLAAGSGPARALREAQEALASDEKTRDPSHWADWVLWGLPE